MRSGTGAYVLLSASPATMREDNAAEALEEPGRADVDARESGSRSPGSPCNQHVETPPAEVVTERVKSSGSEATLGDTL